MKKNTLFFLPMFFLILSSCNVGGDSGPARQPLGTPVITVNAQKNGLTWAAVEGAVSYNVTVNSGAAQSVTNPGYSFSSEEGSYTVSVVAVADDVKYNSEAASYAYSTSKTAVGELSAEGAVITIASVTGMGLEVKLGEGNYADVQGLTYTATESGTYTFHAKAGFNETSKVFYVEGENSSRQIEIDLRSPINAPVLQVNANEDGLTWAAVEGAVSYQVIEDNGEPTTVTTPGYSFNSTAGEHSVKVIAKADNAKYDSAAATFVYETKVASLGALSETEGVITWESAVGFMAYKFNDGEYVEFEGESITATASGVYTVVAYGGFDEDTNTFYYEDENVVSERSISVILPAKDAYVLENGSELSSLDYVDKYYVDYYSSAWAETKNAYIRLSGLNKGYTQGNSALIKFFKNGNAYRFTREMKIADLYDTMTFTIKGDGSNAKATVSFGFRVTEAVSIGGINLQGVYAYYKLNAMPQQWTTYSVSLADEGWKINYGGSDRSFAEVKAVLAQAGYSINSLGELLVYFDVAYMNYKHTSEGQGPSTFAYVDDWQFVNTGEASAVNALPLELHENYAIESDALQGRLNNKNGSWSLSFTYNDNPVTLPVEVTVSGNEATIKSETTGADFVATFTTADYGETLTLKEASGTYGPLFADAKAEVYHIVEDFEQYATVQEFKDEYYADFYNGGSGSVIGGSGWSVMTSTDNMAIAKLAENNHSGSQAGRFKYNAGSDMRYTTVGLSDNTSMPLPMASTFSFWTKGVSVRENHIKIRVYYSTIVTPSTQSSNCVEYTAVIPQGSDWHEVKITLNATHYYGFSILPLKNHGSGDTDAGKYFFIDDICMYNTISPWGKAEEEEPEKIMLNDFQSYTATGKGYDTSNKDLTQISGLRADFFCDYYKGDTSTDNLSPVGGNGWHIMGSTDYMDYAYNSTTGNKSARIKQANWGLNMRYISGPLAAVALGGEDPAPAIGTNLSKFSISIKGGTLRNITVKLFVYFTPSITTSTQGAGYRSEQQITVPQNSDWTEYTVNLDSSKTYYGYAILVNGVSGGEAKADYMYIDNICVW